MKLFKKLCYILMILGISSVWALHATTYAQTSEDPELESTNSTGQPANRDSGPTFISDNGQYIAYQSNATNLDSRSANGDGIYLKNTQTGQNTLVSVNSNGDVQDGNADLTGISGNGRYVFFSSYSSTNLDPQASQNFSEFRYDSVTSTTTLISLNDSNQSVPSAGLISSSYDGNIVTFNGCDEPQNCVDNFKLYVRNISSGSNLFSEGTSDGVISSDGSLLFYANESDNPIQIKKRNLASSNEAVVNKAQDGHIISVSGAGATLRATSGDGTYAYFLSSDPSVVTGEPSDCDQGCIYRRNTVSGVTQLLSFTINGNDVHTSNSFDIVNSSADGNKLLFTSDKSETGVGVYSLDKDLAYPVGYAQNGEDPEYKTVTGGAYMSSNGDYLVYDNQSDNFGTPPVCPYIEPSIVMKKTAVDPQTVTCANVYRSTTAQRLSADTTPPIVLGTPDRASNSAGWYNSPVKITWSSTDPDPSSGTPTTPTPTAADQQGMHVYTSGSSCDPAGNCATGSYTILLDSVIPRGAFTANIAVVSFLGQTIGGNATDDDSGVVAISVKEGTANLSTANGGVTLSCNSSKTSCTWKTVAGKQRSYTGNITVTITDKAGNNYATSKFYTIL